MSEQKIIEKIRKLLALSKNNASLAEAESAALKAQELMARYGVSVSEESEEIKKVIAHVRSTIKDAAQWRLRLASIVAKNFRCKAYYIGHTQVFFGYESDARIAKEVYEYLYRVGNRNANKMYAKVKSETGSGAGVYNSYVSGFLVGLQSKLDEQCTALMLVTPPEVVQKYEEMSKNFRPGRGFTGATAVNSEAFRQGVIDGKNSMDRERKQIGGGKNA